MAGDITEWLLSVGKLLGALVAVGVSLGTLAKFRPVRWVYANLIGNPVSRWFRGEVEEAVKPLRVDVEAMKGSILTLQKASTGLAVRLTEHMLAEAMDASERKEWQDGVDQRLDLSKEWQDGVGERLDSIDARLTDGDEKLAQFEAIAEALGE